MPEQTAQVFDLVVVGGGPGGYPAAIRAAQLGLRTALVEKERPGGVCLNWGCIPTKAMLRSAEVLETMRHSADYGVLADNVRLDWSGVVKRKERVTRTLTDGVAGPPPPAGRALATPLARAVANDRRADVEAAARAGAAAAEGDVEAVPLSAMRRTVARRPVESMQSTPHFYLTITVDAEALLDLRAELNRQLADRGDDLKVSVNDLSVMACARLLRTNPDLYVSFGGDRLLGHRRVHVGIAVALDGGLIVPVVRDADTKTLTQVARETKDLIGRARAGRLATEDLTGGTFTVSNLGMYGTDRFTAPSRRRQRQWNSTGTSPPSTTTSTRTCGRHRLCGRQGPPSLYHPPAYARPCRQGHRHLRPDGGT